MSQTFYPSTNTSYVLVTHNDFDQIHFLQVLYKTNLIPKITITSFVRVHGESLNYSVVFFSLQGNLGALYSNENF